MAELSITSTLEIYDLNTGARTPIREFEGRIEAPNWHPNGDDLIYNANGHIYRYHLPTGEIAQINTGSCNRCNNDHVISADGKSLAISAGTDAHPESRIYVLPIGGGEPSLVTVKSPSYLHGWSPDMHTLAYCAARNGEYDIYTTCAGDAPEVQLTAVEGLNDGPEYSPDGKHIWFNSVRTGLMQVWRMNADGTEQTQMTFDDDRNSWFPHVSPDGEKVAFIAYKQGDVKPGDHPMNKHVEIRMMPYEGGAPETLFPLFGGQGSLNVNSWSPNSDKFAFVSYTII